MSEHNDTWMHIENALMLCDLSSWIDLAHGVITHGRLHRFIWSDAPSGYELERILRDRGIHAYGRMCQYYRDGDRKRIQRWCWVNARQAEFAEYNLLGAGVSLESAAGQSGKLAAIRAWRSAHHLERPRQRVAFNFA